MDGIKMPDFDILSKSLDCHLGRIALNNLKKWKDGIHQVELSCDEVNTHEEVRLRSVKVARGLQTRGLGVGDLIVICGNTHNHICLPILAAFYIGSTIFPFSTTMTIIEAKRMLSLSTPKIIFCDPFMEEMFSRALQELNLNVEIVIFGDVHKDSGTAHITPFSEFLKPTGNEDSFEVADFDTDTTIATISCSSGTTGLPKGVCHSHKSLGLPYILFDMLIKQIEPEPESHGYYMNFSNYYWISSVYSLLMTCISDIPRLICAEPFSEELFDKGLKKYKPSMVFLSPIALHTIIKSKIFDELDFSCLDKFVMGGSLTSDDAIAAIKSKLTKASIVNGYGASEIGSISANTEDKNNSVGKVYPWLKWKIVDIETKKVVKPGEIGELRLKGESAFKGYLNNPEATKDAFDEDGYYKTGDLVKCDDEGYIYFIDRIKEVLKFRNFQITPAELEIEILKIPEVLQVCVVGKKDKEDGEHPVAFVQKTKGSNLTEQDIKDVVKNTLADHKQLRGGVVVMETLPQTGSGKISRKILKEMAQNLN